MPTLRELLPMSNQGPLIADSVEQLEIVVSALLLRDSHLVAMAAR